MHLLLRQLTQHSWRFCFGGVIVHVGHTHRPKETDSNAGYELSQKEYNLRYPNSIFLNATGLVGHAEFLICA